VYLLACAVRQFAAIRKLFGEGRSKFRFVFKKHIYFQVYSSAPRNTAGVRVKNPATHMRVVGERRKKYCIVAD